MFSIRNWFIAWCLVFGLIVWCVVCGLKVSLELSVWNLLLVWCLVSGIGVSEVFRVWTIVWCLDWMCSVWTDCVIVGLSIARRSFSAWCLEFKVCVMLSVCMIVWCLDWLFSENLSRLCSCWCLARSTISILLSIWNLKFVWCLVLRMIVWWCLDFLFVWCLDWLCGVLIDCVLVFGQLVWWCLDSLSGGVWIACLVVFWVACLVVFGLIVSCLYWLCGIGCRPVDFQSAECLESIVSVVWGVWDEFVRGV